MFVCEHTDPRRVIAYADTRALKQLEFVFIHHFQGTTMNKDQVTGKVKDIAGKVQAETGKLVGSTAQQTKGHRLQVEGKTQEILGNAKALEKDTREAAKEALHMPR
jgi:uncharacterized protein YjbJ (UPF0337 family)